MFGEKTIRINGIIGHRNIDRTKGSESISFHISKLMPHAKPIINIMNKAHKSINSEIISFFNLLLVLIFPSFLLLKIIETIKHEDITATVMISIEKSI